MLPARLQASHLCCLRALPLRCCACILCPVNALLDGCEAAGITACKQGVSGGGARRLGGYGEQARRAEAGQSTGALQLPSHATAQTSHADGPWHAQRSSLQPARRHPPASTPFALSSHSPSAPDTEASWSGCTSRQNASSTCRHLPMGAGAGQEVWAARRCQTQNGTSAQVSSRPMLSCRATAALPPGTASAGPHSHSPHQHASHTPHSRAMASSRAASSRTCCAGPACP